MVDIAKITVKYHPTQDRLLFAAQLKNGQRVALWLTSRLMLRVVPCIVAKLNGSLPIADGLKRSAAQQWQQTEAAMSITKTSTVNVTGDDCHILVHSVDVGVQRGKFVLVFRCPDDGGGIRLLLPASNMRQLLQIIHNQLRSADWRRDVWPAWFSVSVDDDMSEQRVLH